MKPLNRSQLEATIRMNRGALVVRLRERYAADRTIRELEAAIGADLARIELIDSVCITG